MKGRWLKHLLSLVILAGVALAAKKYLHGEAVLAALASFDTALLPLLAFLPAMYLVLKGVRFVLMMRPVTQLRDSVIFRAFLAGQAATLVPGGVAARAGLLTQAGEPLGRTVAPVALSSVLDQVMFVLSAILAALAFPAARQPTAITVAVVLGLAALLLTRRVRTWLTGMAERGARRMGLSGPWNDFRESLPAVVTVPRMAQALVLTAVAFFLKIVIFAVSMDGVGHSLPYAVLFLAYILPTMLGRIAPTPGGVGLTEAGMVGLMAATSTIPLEVAAAGVAIFRVASVLYEAVLGALVYFLAWKGEGERPTALRRRARALA